MSEDITIERDGNVGELVIDLPPMNMLTGSAIGELESKYETLDDEQETKAIILSSTGDRAFCAGVAVEDHLGDKLSGMIEAFGSLFETFRGGETPIIAAADGRALGGGCELVAGCDMAVASADAVFGQPEINLGTFPPVAAALFPDLMSEAAAFELIMTGDDVGADRARELGILNRVVEADAVQEEAAALASSFVEKSGPVVGMSKQAFYDVADEESFADALEVANDHSIEITSTEDGQEGLTAFLEERSPEWSY
jgi:enoyl-CoA hydratase/carnithine racemase